MARPERNNVDYFPFYCDEGNKMFYIEEIYGNDGFATFIKILRELAKTDYHYLDLSKPSTLMFLSAKCKVSKDILNSIINDLSDLGKFNNELWTENRIIWCDDFVKSIQDAYRKRNNECITLDGLLRRLDSLEIRKLNKSKSKGDEKPQSKVEYNKEEEIKEDNINDKPTSDKKFSFFDSLISLGVNKQLANDWIAVRKNKKLTNTQTAFNNLKIEFDKCGKPIEKIIEKCVTESWGGFKASWDWKENNLKTLENGQKGFATNRPTS